MSVGPVEFLSATRFPEIAGATAVANPTAEFQTMLAREVGRVNKQLLAADEAVQSLARGEVQNLHQVMIALEEARLGFGLLVQVRTRLLEGYQELLRMQV